MTESVPIERASAWDESRAGRLQEIASKGKSCRAWSVLKHAIKNFIRIDGAQRAAAIAHYAFFSLFPLIILSVTVASVFINHDKATTQILHLVQGIVPIADEKQSYIVDAVAGVTKARRQAGVFAFLLLGWAAMRFVATLIRATNRAWGEELHDWWRLPFKSLAFLAFIIAAAPLVIVIPMLIKISKSWLIATFDLSSWIYVGISYVIPTLILFFGLTVFYVLAPRRRPRLTEVWPAALFTTILWLTAESIFALYLKHFATLNAVYGALGGIMALLLWIYVSGGIFVFGACLCAARADEPSMPTETTTTQDIEKNSP
jgi:YihY family inner membrane protein